MCNLYLPPSDHRMNTVRSLFKMSCGTQEDSDSDKSEEEGQNLRNRGSPYADMVRDSPSPIFFLKKKKSV